jgi:hypothetical protein
MYACRSAATSSEGLTRSVCQAASIAYGLPDELAGSDGGIPPGAVDGGPAQNLDPFYCQGVKPFLARHCVSCHGLPPNASGIATFRLDLYETGGGISGVKDMAGRIQARLSGQPPMPPATALERPSSAEKKLISDWVGGGALECDAGT